MIIKDIVQINVTMTELEVLPEPELPKLPMVLNQPK